MMRACKNCYIPIIDVISFSKDKKEKFCRCPNCKRETKHRRVRDNELSFDEYLQQICEKPRL